MKKELQFSNTGELSFSKTDLKSYHLYFIDSQSTIYQICLYKYNFEFVEVLSFLSNIIA